MTHINLITTAADSHEVVGRIATIARDIYNSLNEFSEFVGVEAISHSTEELPDAVDKLRSVIHKVEEAVNTNLDRLEALNAQAAQTRKWLEDAESTVGACDGEMTRLRDAHPELEEGLGAVQTLLREEIGGRLARLEARSEEHAQVYMTMIANQSFQDLTGQTLKKVIAFIETMQFKLLTLLPNYRDRPAAPPDRADGEAAEPDAAGDQPIQSQDQVDQMLADLGF